MCLGEPARIRTINGANATVETMDGVVDVSLMIIAAQQREVRPGDWVVVSIGLVIDILDADEAEELVTRLAEVRRLEPSTLLPAVAPAGTPSVSRSEMNS